MGMQIIHYVCLLPIKGGHKIKYGSTMSAEAEERLLWFSLFLSGNLNLGSGGRPSPSTFAFTQFLMTIHYYIHVYCIPAIIILILIIISPSTFAVAQILNPVIKFGNILTTLIMYVYLSSSSSSYHHIIIFIILTIITITIIITKKNHLYLQSSLLFYILVSWKT